MSDKTFGPCIYKITILTYLILAQSDYSKYVLITENIDNQPFNPPNIIITSFSPMHSGEAGLVSQLPSLTRI